MAIEKELLDQLLEGRDPETVFTQDGLLIIDPGPFWPEVSIVLDKPSMRRAQGLASPARAATLKNDKPGIAIEGPQGPTNRRRAYFEPSGLPARPATVAVALENESPHHAPADASSKRASVSTACARCGGNCSGKASMSLAALLSG